MANISTNLTRKQRRLKGNPKTAEQVAAFKDEIRRRAEAHGAYVSVPNFADFSEKVCGRRYSPRYIRNILSEGAWPGPVNKIGGVSILRTSDGAEFLISKVGG